MTARDIATALDGRPLKSGGFLAKCPAHDDSTPSLTLHDSENGRVLWCCHAGCPQEAVRDALIAKGLIDPAHKQLSNNGQLKRIGRERKTRADDTAERRALARLLWQRRRPITGTIAERYLREPRCITCALPATLGFLPGNDRYPPALIAAFGFTHETEPGVIAIHTEAVQGVHLTKLTDDGRKRDVPDAKITIGRCVGAPIILAPPNDLLGLAITEGIEDALSIHTATGLGAWAAGSATRMPALADAVPDYSDCVRVLEDADAAGAKNALLLVERILARGIHAEVVPPEAFR